MGGKNRKRRSRLARQASRSGDLKIDRKARSGHYQGTNHAEVYRDGKVYVYTAWNDNEEEVGAEMDFNKWAKSFKER